MGNNTELYELTGRAKALKGYLKNKDNNGYSSVPISDIEGIMFYDEVWVGGDRPFGHPSREEDDDVTAC